MCPSETIKRYPAWYDQTRFPKTARNYFGRRILSMVAPMTVLFGERACERPCIVSFYNNFLVKCDLNMPTLNVTATR